ncbi:CDP-glucose 4,6-dehydratase [Niabella drilacis]|uniref:CDP-glucose 4,6-dehydratase n=1 Tax=Niabella drilacis (strain DSM 25811 / CCM 8410 / CCUG 62505 / LMG 26954 / E90) TaxID=1285928 RepID=A0A1G6ZFH3_NIADE|nr:CDP-glucose 4,6-dehydratase [Niabella drilacis]SDE00997.1 CDP-glucose 4,6-dehydratase [Niabella drilacis]
MESVVNKTTLTTAYSGKKVLITGHTGFKGTWLALWLKELGARVKGYALAPENEQCIFNVTQPFAASESIIADIRNKAKLADEIAAFQPDYIFHLAAQPLVRRSYDIPAETFEVNVTGTANLLEALQKVNGECTVLIITTDKVYDNKEQDILYKEEDPLGGYDPYSASKACTELVVASFRNSFFNTAAYSSHQKALASVRAGNVIGGGDFSKDRILPDIVTALKNQQTILVRNPAAVRPWQHVLEPLGGYLLLASQLHREPAYSGAYNFGPEPADHLTVKELAEQAIAAWGGGTWKDNSNPQAVHEAHLLQLDIEKAKRQLHWRPKLTAKEAVNWTIDWYRQPAAAAASFTFHQINRYMAL